MRLAANISTLFQEYPFLDRIDAAAAVGFKAVECQFPYTIPASEIKSRLDFTGMEMVLINLPAGDWEAGDRGIACQPENRDSFVNALEIGVDYANELNCSRLNCLAGIVPANETYTHSNRIFFDNIELAAARLANHNKTLLIEAINHFDVPGFLINHPQKVIEIIKIIDADNIQFQFDFYHLYKMGYSLISSLEKNLPYIGHIQFSNYPNRTLPTIGEIDYAPIFTALQEINYSGWIGCEYHSTVDTIANFSWLDEFGIQF